MISDAQARELLASEEFLADILTMAASPCPRNPALCAQHAAAKRIADKHAQLQGFTFIEKLRNRGVVTDYGRLQEQYALKYGHLWLARSTP